MVEHSATEREVEGSNLEDHWPVYKHVMIVNYASSGVNKLKASLNDNARVIIYDHHMFIVQATGPKVIKLFMAVIFKFL